MQKQQNGKRIQIYKSLYARKQRIAAIDKIQMTQLTPRSLTPRRTPIQSRPYLSAISHGFHQHSPHHYSGTGSVHAINETKSVHSSQSGDMIYGTNISLKRVKILLQRFITEFQTSSLNQPSETQKIYHTQLSQMDLLQTSIFSVDSLHLKEYDIDLYYQFIYFPAEMISLFDQIIKDLYEKMFMRDEMDNDAFIQKESKRNKLMVIIKRLGEIKIMRLIGTEQVNRLIAFRGIVVRTSDIIPQMKLAYFKCTLCEESISIGLQNAKVQQPKGCNKCLNKNTLQLVHNLCEFTDKQFIKFQQLPEYVPEGQTPHAITVIAYDYNVDAVKPGDRVQVVGIYRVQHQKVMKSRSETVSIFKTHLDLISYRLVDQNRLKGSFGGQTIFNDKDKEEFIKMAQSKDIINQLIQSFAPSIHGNHAIKKGILAQLFGGTKKELSQSGRSRFRSDINICLVGDPSTAKSQLLQQVYRIAPRGIYTSGRGSSAVGLTANVKRDPQTKQFILESGALVLSDLGICCIDEFDKMDNNNKTILLQGMEQQTISIAKAGIVCQLNCRAAIISAANPVNSRYNTKKSVIENINLPPALLSRFDLIYLMLDQPKQVQDTQIAKHLLNLYVSNDPNIQRLNTQKKGTFSKQTLTKYITYARQYVSPVLSQKACDRLVQAYAEMRKMGANTKTITATPRQLESMIRLSQAFAKMKLSNTVEEDEVIEAIDLINIAIQQAATDPVTGRIDMDVIVTGKTASSRQKVQNVADKIKQIVNANVSKYKKKSQFEVLHTQIESHYWTTQKVSEKQTLQALKLVESQGLIVLFGNDKNKPNFKLAKDLAS